jgi:hypothetical protein
MTTCCSDPLVQIRTTVAPQSEMLLCQRIEFINEFTGKETVSVRTFLKTGILQEALIPFSLRFNEYDFYQNIKSLAGRFQHVKQVRLLRGTENQKQRLNNLFKRNDFVKLFSSDDESGYGEDGKLISITGRKVADMKDMNFDTKQIVSNNICAKQEDLAFVRDFTQKNGKPLVGTVSVWDPIQTCTPRTSST